MYHLDRFWTAVYFQVSRYRGLDRRRMDVRSDPSPEQQSRGSDAGFVPGLIESVEFVVFRGCTKPIVLSVRGCGLEGLCLGLTWFFGVAPRYSLLVQIIDFSVRASIHRRSQRLSKELARCFAIELMFASGKAVL